MPNTIAQSVGVDIAKDTLDAHLHPAGRSRRFANDAKGCAALIAWLEGLVIARVAFEPTGAYHQAFERRLAAAGLPLVKVNPRQARRFAEAIGRHAKLVLGPARGRTRGTDAIDAALLEPPVRPVVSAALDAMKELHGARRALVRDRVAARNRDHRHRSPLLKRQLRERLRQIDRQIAAIDTALHAGLAADPALQARFAILVSIPGIGEATAFAMLIERCPNSAPSSTNAPRASPASRPWPGIPASTAVSASCAAAALLCARPSTCRPWSRSGSMPR
jgi:transposase